jgi:hypothetical protein
VRRSNVPLRVDRGLAYEAVVQEVALQDEVVKDDTLAGMQVVEEVVVLRTFGCHSSPLVAALIPDFTPVSYTPAA